MMTRLWVLVLFVWPWMAGVAHGASNPEATAAFDQANKLYEQGKFAEAVLAYDSLIARGALQAGVWFNLGNAAYKSGQPGRAIAAYRMAERVTPRDTALRANLQFVRGKVYSDERPRVSWWKSMVRLASINEWTVLTVGAFWALCCVLGCSEITRRHYPKTVLAFLLATIVGGIGLSASVRDQSPASEAVVIAREVAVRFGPLNEAQAAFQLRDGAEVTVLDTKDNWIQVRDSEARTGWLHREDAFVFPGAAGR